MKNKIANGCMILLMVLMVIAGVAGTKYLKQNKASTVNMQGALASAQTESSKENDSQEEPIETDGKIEEQGSEKPENEPEQPADAKVDQSEKKSEKSPAKTDPSKEKQLDTSGKTDDEKDTEKQPSAKKEPNKTPAAKKEPTKKETLSCTITIRCDTILQNFEQLDQAKRDYVPKNGSLLAKTKVTFEKGATVFDVLKQICKKKKIQLEYSWTPVYNNYYIEGMGQLYEFDCGYESGWVYLVDGKQASYGCSSYKLKGGEEIIWAYSCQGQGADVTGSGR